MRDQASGSSVTAGPRVPALRRSVGQLHGVHRGPVAADADQRRDDARSWFHEALAFGKRYRGQSTVAVIGALGATGIFIAWAVNSGPWS